MEGTNEYYELIDDDDLQVTEGYHSMILVCDDCGALFSMKACGMRSLFEWFGYHPTDGNCMVVTEDFRRKNERLVNDCKCDTRLKRIRSKAVLDQAINKVMNN